MSLITLSQEPIDTLRKDALRVYMASSSDYIKKEIPFINYVRDLKDAQVYIISTSQTTGSGGKEYTYVITGQQEFEGMKDTVSFSTSPDETYEQNRQKEVSTLKMALMRYLVKTPLAGYINIDFSVPLKEEVDTDKWNNWIFSLMLNGYLNGEKSYNANTFFGSFSTKKITKQWKLDFSFDYTNTTDNYEYEDETFRYINIEKSFTALVVKSLGEHWSLGLTSGISQSTYSNYNIHLVAMPGIEFNIFPYSESTRKMFSFIYSAGYIYNDYNSLTIYDKSYQHLGAHSLETIFTIIQKWGNAYFGSEWRNYFYDWDLNNLSFYASIDIRIAKGLSIRIGGGASMIHDQINLEKGGASKEEILLRKKELETQYSYYSQVGISYTFGSIYNNVVNPRFRNGGGGRRIIY